MQDDFDFNNKIYLFDSVSQPFTEELERVKKQVTFRFFKSYAKDKVGRYLYDEFQNKVTEIDPIYEELCLIIAEVNFLASIYPKRNIKINGILMPVDKIKEIYKYITYKHVYAVAEKYKRIKKEISNKKLYMQTMLYNIVFKFNSEIINTISEVQTNNIDK